MRTVTETTKVYKFEELDDSAKEAAISAYHDCNVFDEWWDGDFEDAKTIGLKIVTFGLNPIYANGKWIDGAEEAADLVLEHHGENCETYKTAWEFQNAVDVQGSIFEAQDAFDADAEEFIESEQYNELCEEFLKDLLGDYATILSKNYEYYLSEEAIKETIEANEYEFTEDGEKYNG